MTEVVARDPWTGLGVREAGAGAAQQLPQYRGVRGGHVSFYKVVAAQCVAKLANRTH